MQLIHNTLKDIKDTDNTAVSSVLTDRSQLSSSLLDVVNGVLSGNIERPVGAYNLALCRHPTLTEREQQQIAKQRPIPEGFGYEVPGVGEQCPESNPKENPEFIQGVTKCKSCGKVDIWVGHCQGWECPVCSKRKIAKNVYNAMDRLHGFRESLNLRVNPLHWVLTSTRFDDMTVEQIRRSFRNFVQRYIPHVGGVYCIHLFRVRGWDNVESAGSAALFDSDYNIKRKLREYLGANDTGRGFWNAITEDALGLGDWKQYVYVSPHIHFLGYGFIEDTKGIFEKSGGVEEGGFLLKCIDKKGKGRGFDFSPSSSGFTYTCECENTLSYLGSHAFVPVDRDNFVDVKIKKINNRNGSEYDDCRRRRKPIRLFSAFGVCSSSSMIIKTVKVPCCYDLVRINNHWERIPTDEKYTPIYEYFGGHYDDNKDKEIGIKLFKPELDENNNLKYPIHCPVCSSLDVVKVDKDDHQAMDRGEFDHWTDDFRPAREDGSIIESLERCAPAGYEKYKHYYFFHKWKVYKIKDNRKSDDIKRGLKIPIYRHKEV